MKEFIFGYKKFVITILILILIRLLLPYAGYLYINHVLQTKFDYYTGRISDFDLSLFRGAYQIQELEFEEKESKSPRLLEIKEMDIAVSWKALFQGKVLANLVLDQVKINIPVSNFKESKIEDENKSHWSAAIDSVIPLKLNSIELKDSEIRGLLLSEYQEINSSITEIHGKVEHLRLRKDQPIGNYELHAKWMGEAPFLAKGKIDILEDPFTLDLNLSLVGLDLAKLNPVWMKTVPLDLTKSKMTLFLEFAKKHHTGKGYARVFLEQTDVISPGQKYQSIKHLVYEWIASFAGWVLSLRNNKIAAEIPMEIQNGEFKVDTSEAFWSSLRNLWDEIEPEFRNDISLEKLEGFSEVKDD